MQKFHLVVEKKIKGEILSYLQERGDVEVIEVKSKKTEEVSERALDLTLAELEFVLDFLKRKIVRAKTGFFGTLGKALTGPPEYAQGEFEKTCLAFDYSKAILEVKELENTLTQLEIERNKLEEELVALAPWEKLELSSRELETNETLMLLGTIGESDLPKLGQMVNGEVYIRKVSQVANLCYIVTTYLKDNQDHFLAGLNMTGFNPVTLELEGTPRQEIGKLKARLEEIKGRQAQTQAQIQEFAPQEMKLKMVYDYLRHQRARQEARERMRDTIYTSLIAGWTTKPSFRDLAKKLPQKFPGVYISKTQKGKAEKVPVVIANQRLVEPFEAVTRVYGMPGYQELDPTPYLSVFFAIFFGMCLSDAGYGIVLLVFSILGLKFLKLSEGFKRLLRLMIYGGITTIIVGVLYGAYFSIPLNDLQPSFWRDFLLKLQLIDPIKSPLQIMIISLVFGFLQLWFARFVNFKYHFSKKNFQEAFLGDFIWVLTLGAIVFFLCTKIFLPGWGKIGLYALLGGLGLLVLTQGHKKKNIILKFLGGVMSLYNFVGMLSDLLSYSRLLALGLTTSIIGLVVNVIALLFRDMIPYAGIVVMILILIGGHLFNLGINILGGFIHSARLQFVEFFPKFLEGGGRNFKPLRKEYKFVRVKSKV